MSPITLDQTLPFLIFSLVAAITPGPGNVMIFWQVVVLLRQHCLLVGAHEGET